MKIKTVTIIFAILSIIVFPYYILFLLINSDSVYSIIPGWHSTIVPGQIISNLFKFLALLITTFCYWKLSKIESRINLKNFLVHFSITIPAVFIGKISLYEVIDFHYLNVESIMTRIQIVVFINVCINILFFCGQILFVIKYRKVKRNQLK